MDINREQRGWWWRDEARAAGVHDGGNKRRGCESREKEKEAEPEFIYIYISVSLQADFVLEVSLFTTKQKFYYNNA